MSTANALDHFFDPPTGWLTRQVAQKIVDWKPDPAIRARILELGQKASEGRLTAEENAEYEQYIDEGDLIALLQLKARHALGQLPAEA